MGDKDKKCDNYCDITHEDIGVDLSFSDHDYGDSFFSKVEGRDYSFDDALAFTKINYAKIIRELEDK
ncbi:hypothetical protein [Providencia sp. PROV024]|uniref:hypothetical protein n=1 Tax=Providencia sp. PROV024 TaxID=2949758 RepID=UPI00234B5CA6|nr:hypothetical protein [Providencia sp. PROV024]EJD6501055.1 hypothetical protein [Providencia rettgeri]ELL9155534.1 hypothetical protein [Providencia rettgeri]ELR5063870.1 hypothetical protein [Providencia rettgeri]ELR5099261.1 hypothetical protein [Providencia rettgeri]ELR5205730.1 hypothetical protein [Providencia rettgeri]